MWNHELSHAPFLIVYITTPLSHLELARGMITELAEGSDLRTNGHGSARLSYSHGYLSDSFIDNLCVAPRKIYVFQTISCAPR